MFVAKNVSLAHLFRMNCDQGKVLLECYLKMTGHDESTFFAAGHIESELLFGRQSEELASEPSHLADELCVDGVIHHLKNPPIFARLHDLPANLRSLAVDLVDSGERYHRNFAAEHVVRHLRKLVFVSDEFRLKRLLFRES